MDKPIKKKRPSQKLQLKGDYDKERLIQNISDLIRKSNHEIFYWPTLYFGVSKSNKQTKGPNKWEPRPTCIRTTRDQLDVVDWKDTDLPWEI